MSSTTTAKSTRDGRVVEILVHFTAELLVLISLWFLTLEKDRFPVTYIIKWQHARGRVKSPTAVYHQRATQIHVYSNFYKNIHIYIKCAHCPSGYCHHPDVYLHPEEESFGARFKLQHINSSGRALIHPFELTVVGKNDKILNEGELTFKKTQRQ